MNCVLNDTAIFAKTVA